MINAKIHVQFGEGAGYLIEFSDPQGNYKDNPDHFITVSDKTDLLRRLYFKNRMYICDTFLHWFNQRLHCYPDDAKKIEQLQFAFKEAKKIPYEELCSMVAKRAAEIEKYAPTKLNSPFKNHYETIIQPILTECENVYTGKAKVHYC